MLGALIGAFIYIVIAVISIPAIITELNASNVTMINGISNTFLVWSMFAGIGVIAIGMLVQAFKPLGLISDDKKEEPIERLMKRIKDEDEEEVKHEDITPIYKTDKNKFKENKWE